MLVVHLLRNYAAYTSLGTPRVTFSSGNQVYVRVENSLSRDRPAIGANIESFDSPVRSHQFPPKNLKQLVRIESFPLSHREEALGMALGQNEMMPIRHRVAVPKGPDGAVLGDGPLSATPAEPASLIVLQWRFSGVGSVSVAIGLVARGTEHLKIRQLVRPALGPGNDVVDLERGLPVRGAAQSTATIVRDKVSEIFKGHRSPPVDTRQA